MKSSVSHGSARPGTRSGTLSIVRLPVLALLVGLSLPLLMGCPGALEGTWPPPVSGTGGSGAGTGGATGTGGGPPCDAPAMVFTAASCNINGCHGSMFSNLPDLSGADPFANLMGKNAVSPVGAACVGMPYVTAGNPPTGVLMKRVTGETCGPGTRMPSGSATGLPQMQIDCLASWLSSKL